MWVQASVKNIGRAVQRMPSAELLTQLQSPDLLPGLFEAFDHQSADVRKAVTMCLMHMWQVHTALTPLPNAAHSNFDTVYVTCISSMHMSMSLYTCFAMSMAF